MSAAPLLAAAAGGIAVLAVWEATAAVERAVAVERIAAILRPLAAAGRTGHEPTPPERRRLAVVAVAVLLSGGWLLAGATGGLLAAAGGPFVLGRLVAARRSRWRAALAAGAPQAARAVAEALAGGHSVRGALTEAARTGGANPATDGELRAVASSLAMGATTEDALKRLRRRAGDPVWDTIVAAILLQRDTGGDLAHLLRGLAGELERARRAEADARAATAQARFTARLVVGLPVGGAVLCELAAPGTLGAVVGDPLAVTLLAAAAVLEVVALFLVSRLARLEPR